VADVCEFCSREGTHDPDCALFRPKPRKRCGSIYFIQEGGAGGLIKIGHTSRKCEERKIAIQIGNPRRLELLVDTSGSQDDESTLHRYFSEHGAWVRGEWFCPTVALLELIEALNEGVSLESWLSGVRP